MADLTRILTGEGTLWLASVRDAFSSRVAGWKTSGRAGTEVVLGALEYALWSRDVRAGHLITQLGWDTAQGPPKSDAGERQVALDADTVAAIRLHRQRQDSEKQAAGDAWTETGFEFTSPDGTPVHPAAVTDMFELIAYLAGLPPVRLHDLRHGAATLLLAAGHDMKVVQETLGLSSITIAADTYTSVLPQLARQSAEDVAALIRPAPASRPAAASQVPATRNPPGHPGREEPAHRGQRPPTASRRRR